MRSEIRSGPSPIFGDGRAGQGDCGLTVSRLGDDLDPVVECHTENEFWLLVVFVEPSSPRQRLGRSTHVCKRAGEAHDHKSRAIIANPGKRSRLVHDVAQDIDIAAARGKGLVLFQDHDLCVAQRPQLRFAEIAL